jgi:hypothetical protein
VKGYSSFEHTEDKVIIRYITNRKIAVIVMLEQCPGHMDEIALSWCHMLLLGQSLMLLISASNEMIEETL